MWRIPKISVQLIPFLNKYLLQVLGIYLIFRSLDTFPYLDTFHAVLSIVIGFVEIEKNCSCLLIFLFLLIFFLLILLMHFYT